MDLIAKAKRLVAEERNAVAPAAAAGSRAPLSVALAFPSRYYTAMSNLGFQTVYRLFNEQPGVSCQRVFLPDPEDIEEYRRAEVRLFTLESQQPVRSYDVLAFSVSYENDYANLLKILDLSGIALLKEDRSANDPLVIAGGATILMNPEPLADFVDLFVIGEAEAVLPALTEPLHAWKQAGKPRESLLAELAQVEGVYVPRFYEVAYRPDGPIGSVVPAPGIPSRVKRVWLKDLDQSYTASAVVTPNTELSGMYLVELSRGCRRGCRFCAGCYSYFPHRVRSGTLLETNTLRDMGAAEKVGLVGAAISDFPDLLPLGRSVLANSKPLSFSSLRVDTLSPEVADLIIASGQKTVTLAPEAGSERLRRAVNKGFSEVDILRAAATLAERGVRNFRFYFMIGLPTERMEDVKAIIELTKKIRHQITQKSRQPNAGRITLSVNSFVPKAGTPFQWHPFEEVRTLNEKIKFIKNALRRERSMTAAADVPRWAYLQSLLARGDRRVGKILLRAHQLGGNWAQAYRSVDINPDFFVYRQRDREEILPWDFIDHGVSKDFLWKEYRKGLEEGAAESVLD